MGTTAIAESDRIYLLLRRQPTLPADYAFPSSQLDTAASRAELTDLGS